MLYFVVILGIWENFVRLFGTYPVPNGSSSQICIPLEINVKDRYTNVTVFGYP